MQRGMRNEVQSATRHDTQPFVVVAGAIFSALVQTCNDTDSELAILVSFRNNHDGPDSPCGFRALLGFSGERARLDVTHGSGRDARSWVIVTIDIRS